MNYENHPMFRLLQVGEVIEEGDEFFGQIDGTVKFGWIPVEPPTMGGSIGETVDEYTVPVRRRQEFEGRWVGDVTEHHGLVRGHFFFRTNSSFNGERRYTPPVNAEFSECSLYVVRVQGKSWIPANLLVWARDEEHALERVMDGFETCTDLWVQYRSDWEHPPLRHVNRVLEGISDGTLEVRVQPADWRLILAVPWADNSGM